MYENNSDVRTKNSVLKVILFCYNRFFRIQSLSICLVAVVVLGSSYFSCFVQILVSDSGFTF